MYMNLNERDRNIFTTEQVSWVQTIVNFTSKTYSRLRYLKFVLFDLIKPTLTSENDRFLTSITAVLVVQS